MLMVLGYTAGTAAWILRTARLGAITLPAGVGVMVGRVVVMVVRLMEGDYAAGRIAMLQYRIV
jgi:hypothetical protein